MTEPIQLQGKEKLPRAILVGLCLSSGTSDRETYARSMEELRLLAQACDLQVVDRFIQYASSVTHRSFIGSGKVSEIRSAILMADADIVVFNETLSPLQIRNLEQEWDTEVLDKTGIILQIFSERAGTREARLQVESARLKYILPRLAGMHQELGRQGGGSGRLSNKGAGEEKLELDRRRIERRITEADRELEQIRIQRKTQREKRLSSGLPRISLVGYTNAGKSTILNRLLDLSENSGCGSPTPETVSKKVLEKDMLFATLDTSVRAISVRGHHPFLLSDTVGFISDLPHTLIKAFHSTLEEAVYADLLLIVCDCSDPDCEHQLEVTRTTLEEIGAGSLPRLLVYNKADLQPDYPFPSIQKAAGDSLSGSRIVLSAASGTGLEELLNCIDDLLNEDRQEMILLLPYQEGSLLHTLQQRARISEPEYLPEGIKVRAVLNKSDAALCSPYRIPL